MTNLKKKDVTLNWEIPVSTKSAHSSSIPEDFILLRNVDPKIHHSKYGSTFLSFNQLSQMFFFEGEERRIAVSFDEEKLIFCFNPPEGVPFYKLSKSGNSKVLNNKRLIDKIYDHFKLDKNVKSYFLKAHYLTTINDMKLYRMTPQSYETRLPLLEDELNGKMNIH